MSCKDVPKGVKCVVVYKFAPHRSDFHGKIPATDKFKTTLEASLELKSMHRSPNSNRSSLIFHEAEYDHRNAKYIVG
jgi:hypothetical protein